MLDQGHRRAHAHRQSAGREQAHRGRRRSSPDHRPASVGGSCRRRRRARPDAGAARRVSGEPPRRSRSSPRPVHLVDAARKVVGVGSVGTRCWIALLEGGGHDDPLILQIKEAQESVLEPYLGRSAIRQPRPPRRRGSAAHASRQRPVPGMDPRRDFRRRLLLAQPARHEGVRQRQCPADEHVSWPTQELCGGNPAPEPTPVPATRRPSPVTSAKETPSARRSAASPSRMPIRTHVDHAALVQAIKDGQVPAEANV